MLKFLTRLFNRNKNNNLKSAIENGGFLVDVRTPEEFAAGHVERSVNIPLDRIFQQLADFKNKKQIIVFCQSGHRGGQAKKILNHSGIHSVINGGSWSEINKLIPE